MKEIVTLQLGHSSSFVGTHLWNALDVSDHYIDKNTLMRSGLDAESGLATYAPRLVIVDLKGSLGSLKRINQLYENAQDQEHVAWNGKVHVSRQDAAPKNEYLTYLESEEAMDEDDPKQPLQDQPPKPQKQFAKALDSSVQVWSDFNSMFYHPRTVVELGSYSHGDTVAPFAIYNQGADLWTQDHALQEEVLEDRIRFFLEECDSPQGIQVLADVSNAFAGFTAACLESLREDVGKMCVTVFGVSDDCDSVTEPVKNFNEALALARVTEFSSLYVPVRKPRSGKPYRGSDFGGFGVKSNLQSRYHWTACLAAAIDTITLPTRVATNSVSLSAVLHPVASAGPLGMLASSVPFPFSSANTVKELFSRELNVGDHVDWLHDATFDEPFDVMEECEGQVSVLRGISGSFQASDAMNSFLSKSATPIGRNNSYAFDSPFPISLAFPDIFTASESSLAATAPTFARIKASGRLGGLVQQSIAGLKGVPGKVSRMLEEQGVGSEFLESNVDDLGALLAGYEEL